VVDIDDDHVVDVPSTRCPLQSQHYQELFYRFDPLGDSTSYGEDIYVAVLEFVTACVDSYNNCM